jgi:predicted nucleic acid-binding Zn finger protein
MTIISKTLKDGRTMEIKKTGAALGEVAVYVDGSHLLTGHPVAAIVKGRPEITHVIGGKVALTADERNAISDAYATEIAEMLEEGRKEDETEKAYRDQYNKIANA